MLGWLRKARAGRRARKLLAAAFDRPEVLRGTSLKPRHRSRWVLLSFEEEDGEPRRIRFGIVRHPRPYPFSPQSHKVLEEWLYEVREGRLRRMGGRNLTRGEGRDAD